MRAYARTRALRTQRLSVFFAFTPPLYPLDILRFVGEGFVFPDFFTGEA